jgi:hypothetical protein
MTPELSRRVSNVMATDPVRALGILRHVAFVDEVSMADTFEALPVWVRAVILAGERQVAEDGPPRRP